MRRYRVNWGRPLILSVIGPPVGGKDTLLNQIRDSLIGQGYEPPIVSTGDICREQVKKKTEIGKEIAPIIKVGDIVPSDIIMPLLEERVKPLDLNEGLLFNGVPRVGDQAPSLDYLIKRLGYRLDLVIYLLVPDSELRSRAKYRMICSNENCKGKTIYHLIDDPPQRKGICDECGYELKRRPDDKNLPKRLKIHRKESRLIVDYFLKKENVRPRVNGMTMEGKIALVNGVGSPVDTYNKACTYIDLYQRRVPF